MLESLQSPQIRPNEFKNQTILGKLDREINANFIKILKNRRTKDKNIEESKLSFPEGLIRKDRVSTISELIPFGEVFNKKVSDIQRYCSTAESKDKDFLARRVSGILKDYYSKITPQLRSSIFGIETYEGEQCWEEEVAREIYLVENKGLYFEEILIKKLIGRGKIELQNIYVRIFIELGY
jgi:hypothetical protein